jgi:hypothetical protein
MSAVGEEITGGSEIGRSSERPGTNRSYLVPHHRFDNSKRLDIPPNTITGSEGFTVLKDNTLITNFQPHFHSGGSRCSRGDSADRPAADRR